MLICLMGKSGSGKTLIGSLFKELNPNINVIDVDKIGHRSHLDEGVKQKIINTIGDDVIDEHGNIDRKKLSNIVFNDKNKMKLLCEATYGFMESKIDRLILESSITILDYALLTKTKYFNMCDLKILVKAGYSQRLERVTKRDKISVEKYNSINSNSLDYDESLFDYVINNDSNVDNLRKAVDEIYEKSIVLR